MVAEKSLLHISSTLQDWYQIHKRELPWRDSKDPYIIWISEIILQQTRVSQGYDYFVRFINRFPDIKTLASSDEIEVLKCWQGLGYYSRARNLHTAAKQIMLQHNGQFPCSHSDILTLKGIGDYTAAAIASFAFLLPHAVVDGNVYRFLSRFFGIFTPINTSKGKREFTTLAKQLLDTQHPDIHNQAIMEFGALQCVPSSPDCSNCPLQNGCFAYENAQTDFLPAKEKSTKITHRYFYYFVIQVNDNLLIQKRTQKDIWQNLYEFPLFESNSPMELSDILQSEWIQKLNPNNTPIQILSQSPEIKHVLSHQIIHARFYTTHFENNTDLSQQFVQINNTDLSQYPVSRLTEKFLESHSQNLHSQESHIIFT